MIVLRWSLGCGGWIAALVIGSATQVQIAGAESVYPGWVAGESVPLAVNAGPLGATREYEATPLGTADVFGNGPYDLFLREGKLFPFQKFMPDGTPLYGQPVDYQAPARLAAIVTDQESVIWGIFNAGKTVKTAKFDRARLSFEPFKESPVPMPKGARSFAATLTPQSRLITYFSVPDDQAYQPDDAHPHSPDFQPFNGSGIWRGGLPYSGLGAALLIDGTALGKSDVRFPIFGKGRDFLFSNPGMTVVNLAPDRERDVLASDKHGTFHYFHNRAQDAINLEPRVFVSDERGNALRHPGINPSLAALPDPQTGLSDLLVGDTGLMWFYNFTGRFNELGGPIYDPPVRAMVEKPVMALSALPVITAGDLDGDGLIDLVAGNDVGDFYFIRNIGTPQTPGFDVPQPIMAGGQVLKVNAGYGCQQGPGEARWGYTCPTLVDWNNDGSLDIIYNSIHGDVTVLMHRPDTSPPQFDAPVILKCDSLELRLVWRTQPAVTDWGIAGQQCIIVNDEQNRFRRFWRIDDYNVRRGEVLRLTTGEPIQAHSRRFAGQLGRTKLQAVDWDQDGVIDLIAGTGRAASIPGKGGYPDDAFKGKSRQASVLFLRNAGTNADPVFEHPRLIYHRGEKIAMGTHTCSPLAVDLGRGDLDLLVGMEEGVVLYYPREELSWPKASSTQE